GRQEDVTGEVDSAENASALPAADRQATEVGVLDPPRNVTSVAEIGVEVMLVEGSSGGRGAGNLAADLAVLVELVDLGGGAASLDFDHDLEAHRDFRIDLRITGEDEAARGVGVVQTVVGLLAKAIIVPDNRAMHLAGDRQGHLAIALARRGGLQFRNA